MTAPLDFAAMSQQERDDWAASGARAYREREAGRIIAPATGAAWREPKAIPEGLLPVAPFAPEFLPARLAPWANDVAERMQCPLDFVAVPALVAAGAVIGRRIGIRPQAETDWTEVPNLWGCVVGRPGTLKSPAAQEALKPLHRLEAEARKANEAALRDYDALLAVNKIEREVQSNRIRDALKKGLDANGFVAVSEPEPPKSKRYVTNDTTYEALGAILAENPNGVLAFRDELVSLLKTLDREEHAGARGFFLAAWNGTQGYSFDRIIRGRTHIEAACVSLLGSTQPGRLAEFMRGAVQGGAGDDGLVQRFGLLVWPDHSMEWRDIDRAPLSEPRRIAFETFGYLDTLDPLMVGASQDDYDELPFVRFDPTAQGLFREWRCDLESRLRSGEMSAALESHLAKYRKLVPALSLISHLSDGHSGPVGEASLLRALGDGGICGNARTARLCGRERDRGVGGQNNSCAHPSRPPHGWILRSRGVEVQVERTDRTGDCESRNRVAGRLPLPRRDSPRLRPGWWSAEHNLRDQPKGEAVSAYLTRLRAITEQNPLPEELPKLPKPGSGSFGSDRGGGFPSEKEGFGSFGSSSGGDFCRATQGQNRLPSVAVGAGDISEWWTAPVPGWREGRLEIRNLATGAVTIIDLRRATPRGRA